MWWDCGRWFLMQNYEKPEVILMTECSEGVYLASGGQTGEDPTAGGCDSRYMKGAWKKPDYSNSNVQMRAYDRKGCEGCAADGVVEKMPACRSGRKFMLDSANTEIYT